MNRLVLWLGLASVDMCWVYPWALLAGIWAGTDRPLLSAASIFGLLVLASLATRLVVRGLGAHRAGQATLVGLGLLTVLLVVRLDQYPETPGVSLEWLGAALGALAVAIGQPTAPALAIALGLLLWWRGVRVGSQPVSFGDVEGAFRWGIGALIAFGGLLALATRPSQLPGLEAQTSPFVVGFFFASLLTLALARLESFRTGSRALAVNSQWLTVLVAVVGVLVLVALVAGQLLSFDLLTLASRPVFELIGRVLVVLLIAIVIPLAYLAELVAYVLRRLLRVGPEDQPPQPPTSNDLQEFLTRLLGQALPPELIVALKAVGVAVVVVAVLWLVARTIARWRPGAASDDPVPEERESVWEPGGLRAAVREWLRGLFKRLLGRREPMPAMAVAQQPPHAGESLSSVRDVYRQLLRLGEARGAPRAPAVTPLEHLPALQRSLGPAEAVADITQAYVQVRYAEDEPSSDDVERVVAEWRRVQAGGGPLAGDDRQQDV